jgi:predicted DNA-binding protein YlxM (UPF0122 family)
MRTRRSNTRAQELRRAKRWLAKHGIGSLPPKQRAETGESLEPQRSDWLAGPDRPSLPTHLRGGGRTRVVSYSWADSLEAWEEWMSEAGRAFLPVNGGGELTLEQVEKQARLQHVLEFLLPMHVDLLFARFAEQRTLDDIAEEFGISRQAVIKRLRVAVQDLKREIAAHWNDPLSIEEALE